MDDGFTFNAKDLGSRRVTKRFRDAAAADPNWAESPKGPRLLPLIIVTLAIYAIFSLVATIFGVVYREPESGNDLDEENAAAFLGGLRFVPVAVEAIHLPLHILAYLRGRLHPASAIGACTFMFLMWAATIGGYMVVFEDLGGRARMYLGHPVWILTKIVRATAVCLLCLRYLAYIYYACGAWRKRSSTSKMAGGAVEGSSLSNTATEIGTAESGKVEQKKEQV